MDLIKIKTFSLPKTLVKKLKDKLQRGRKCLLTISDKGLVYRMFKELLNLSSKKNSNNPIRKWAKNMSRYFTAEDI